MRLQLKCRKCGDVFATKEQVLAIIKEVLGSKNPNYPDSTYELKRFEKLADAILEETS